MRRRQFFDTVRILLGTCLMAVAVNMIFEPLGMVTGGVTGIGILLKKMTSGLQFGGVPVWVTNFILNVPLFVAAYFIKGRQFLGRTFFATLSLTVFLLLIPSYGMFKEDYLLTAVFGGAISGAGIGLVLRARATTGGTDLFCTMLRERLKHYSVPQLMIAADGVIILAGAAVFGIQASLYAVIAVLLIAKVSDAVLEGFRFYKMIYVISKQYQVIAARILTNFERGVSGLSITGMYSSEERTMLLCVMTKKELAEVLSIVYQNDPAAFVIVCDVREVMGEGFVESESNFAQ